MVTLPLDPIGMAVYGDRILVPRHFVDSDIMLSDGTRRTFRRVDDSPKVEIDDPLAAHRKLLETYTDRDMHNVTAFLVTLK